MKATATKLIEKECQRHLAAQGITSQKKLEHRLQDLFEQAEHQEAALISLYKMLIPDWERIERLEGHPIVGRGLWQYIGNLFIDFDQRNHPQIFNGGLWLNQGFSSSDEIGPWEISMDQCNVIYS
ncbi:hypothetical protein [Desulfobacter curvatus]|uniref:hypothetical protein n=1 Tax=Desulfobacter curvatus TaxID=2290 RepID=UPI0003703FF8|nr:hypothetical protein [Desulfobacter curvatus]